ncbi:nicotinate phosphoribosyltransferase isoform 4-T4 [Lycaon pictus]
MAAEQDPEARAAAGPLLTDLYQATMALGYWRAGRAREQAEFELFFRGCPFGGAFALAAGLRDCVRFLRAFRLRDADVQFLASVLPPDTDPAFFEHLRALDCSDVTVRALPEGSLAFPNVPLLQVSGPLLVVQLLETPLLCLVSYARWGPRRSGGGAAGAGPGPWRGPPPPPPRDLPTPRPARPRLPCPHSLIATNAARLRLIAGPEKRLLEMGLRRAQGPDGGLTASTYSYLGDVGSSRQSRTQGGPDCSCGGMAGWRVCPSGAGGAGAPPGGAGSLCGLCPGFSPGLPGPAGHLQRAKVRPRCSPGWALQSGHSPSRTLLVPAHRSGLPNFLAVALALGELGYRAVGIRLDSGDLLQQAQEIRGVFRTVSARFQMPWLESISIAVSNNIDEKELARLAQEGSEVNVIGIGTNVVTCPRQPSLGCVYKLVSVGGQPRMKLTEDPEKQTLPGSKAAFRLLGPEGSLLLDVLQLAEEPPPQAGQELRVWPHGAREACTVRPAGVEPLLRLWVQQGQLCEPLPSLAESRAFAQLSLSRLSPEHKRLEWPALYQVGARPHPQLALGPSVPTAPASLSSSHRLRCLISSGPWWTDWVREDPRENHAWGAALGTR